MLEAADAVRVVDEDGVGAVPPDRALVWAQPDSKKVVGRLPSKQRVSLLGRQGTWVRIEFKRGGKQISGWTMDSNLQLN